MNESFEIATFGGGCFWCVEAVFQRIEGVTDVRSGYMGGEKPNPSYEDVCRGDTGHAEVVQLRFDSRRVSFEDLLKVFWSSHDPTTPNRQGADRGTQYRSVIFHHDDAQREKAESVKKRLDDEGAFGVPIVTEISPAGEFYEAEPYHQDYYNRNSTAPYCQAVIQPKLAKLGVK